MSTRETSYVMSFARRHAKALALMLTVCLVAALVPTQSVAFALDEAVGEEAQVAAVEEPAPEPEPEPAPAPEPEPAPEPAPAEVKDGQDSGNTQGP